MREESFLENVNSVARVSITEVVTHGIVGSGFMGAFRNWASH